MEKELKTEVEQQGRDQTTQASSMRFNVKTSKVKPDPAGSKISQAIAMASLEVFSSSS
jgi:hypothetical protein